MRTRDDFVRYRKALAELPRLPKLLPDREHAPDFSWEGANVRLLLGSEQCAGQFNVAVVCWRCAGNAWPGSIMIISP